MNRLPDTGRGYRYGRPPEDRFLQRSQQGTGEGFNRFAQGNRFNRRDLLSSSESLLGMAPRPREHGYGSGQWNVPFPRPHVPELQPNASLAAAEALLLGQLLLTNSQLQANTLPSREPGYERREGHQYTSNFQNLSWPPQRNRYHTGPPKWYDNYSDSGRDTFSRSGSPYGSGNVPRPALTPVYHDSQQQRIPPADVYRSTASRQETSRRESFLPSHQAVLQPYDHTRPEPRDGSYSSGDNSQISNDCPLRSSNSLPSYPPRSFREEEYRAGSHYTRSGGSYGSHREKPFPSRRSPPLSEPIRGSFKQGYSHRDVTGRTDNVPVRSHSPGSGGNYGGSRRTASSSNSTKEGDTQLRQQSYKETTTSFEKQPMMERVAIRSESKSISAIGDPPSVHAGDGRIGDRFKSNMSSAVESRLGPVPDDPSRSSIQSRLGPSPLQPVGSIQARLGPKISQSCTLPVPTEHSSHVQVSPAMFMPAETHITPSSSEPLSDLRLELQEQRRASVDRDLKSSSSSPAQSLPLPGCTGSLSPVNLVRRPLAPLPLTPESKDSPGVLSPSGGKKQGLKSPQLQSHALHKQHSHGSSKSMSATPTLTSPEGGKALPSETRKLKPITIRRPKTPTGSTLVQTVPVTSKKSISPRCNSTPPDTEPPKTLDSSLSDQKKTTPTEDHESKDIMSKLPASPLPTGMSAKPGMDASIKPATSPIIIKPSTCTSKPLSHSQPVRAHATASLSNPSDDDSGATVKPTPMSKSRARHKTGNLPNPFSEVHTSHVADLKGTPSSTMTRKIPKLPFQERRQSGSSLSSAQQKHSSTHQKCTTQKHTPVTRPKRSPPHPTSDKEAAKVAKLSTEPVKLAEDVHGHNIPEHEVNAATVALPESTGAIDVLNPSSDAHAPPPPSLLQDVLPFSGFDEIPQPVFPSHPHLQSPTIQHEPPSLESVPTQLNPPHVEHSSMHSQPRVPQTYSVHTKESLVEKLDDREEGELDMSDDSDGGLVIDETASGTDDPCTETKDSEVEAVRSNLATAADHMEIPPTADPVGITPLTDHTEISPVTDHMEIPPDYSRTPPVVAQMGTLGSSTSHPLMRPSQSPSAQLGTRNLIHKQPQSSFPSTSDHPQSNPERLPNRVFKVERIAISTIGKPLVTILNRSPRPEGKGQVLLKKLYSSCMNVFAYKGRTRNQKVIDFMQNTFKGSAFARDVGPSWNPVKPTEVYVSELRHILHLCGDDVDKWWEQVNHFALGARTLKKSRNLLKRMMKVEKAASRGQKVPLLASGKSQPHRKPHQPSHFKKATSKFGARASAWRNVPNAPPNMAAPYHFDAPPSHYHQAGLGLLAEDMTHPPLHIKQEQHETVGGGWFEDRSENWTNVANEPPLPADLLLSPSIETAVGNVREPTMEHAMPLMGAEPDMDQYPPSLLPSSRTELDMNLDPVEMDLDTSQDLEQPDDEIVPPTDAEFSTQQIEQLQDVVGQLLELEMQVQRTVGQLATESYDYGHSSNLVPTPPFESTEFLPPGTPLDTQEVELQRQAPHLDFVQTPPVHDSASYEEYPPFSIFSGHTPSLPPSVLPAESVRSGVKVEPKNSSVDTNVDIMDQLPPGLDLQGTSEAISAVEPSETTFADRSNQPLESVLPEPHTPLSGSLSNIPQESVPASPQNMTETSAIQSSGPSLTRDVSLSPGEITPSPVPSPIPPPTAESKVSGTQGTEKLGSFAQFSAEEHTSALSHVPYHAPTQSLPLRNMSSSGRSSPSQLRSGRPGYSRRHHYHSWSRSPSPRRRYHQRSHSRTPSPRRSLKSYRGRACRSPSPSRHHHHLSSTSGSRSSYRNHHGSSTASDSRRVNSPVTRKRHRRLSRSRSRSLSPTRGRRSRRSRSYSPSQRTSKYSRSQSTSPSRGRRSRLSRSPVHSTERRGHRSLVQSKTGRRRSRTGSRSLSPRAVPKPSTESESEEDIELLQLKREAIMSMIKKEDAVKSIDVGGSEQKTSCGEGVSLKSSNSRAEDFTKNIPDVSTVASVSTGEMRKGDEVEMKDETEKKAVEEEVVGKADKKAFEEEKPDTVVATDDANKSKDTGAGQALSACSKTKIEVWVDSAGSETADRPRPQPQEPIKPVEPAQRSLSQPVRRPAEAAEGVQLTAQTVVRSRSSSRRSSPTCRIGSRTGSPALSPLPSSSAALGQKTRGILPANRGAQTQKPASSAKVCPGKEDTWKIQTFCIMSGSGDSASSGSESESDIDVVTIEVVKPAPEQSPMPVSMEEINKMLMEARRAAEAKVRSPPSQLHPLPPASLPSSRKKLESTSSSEGLELPSPPASLKPEQKKEYLELQKRLALHKKRKRKEMKLTKEKGEKGEASSHPDRPTRLKPKARSTTPTDPPSKKPWFRRPALKKTAVVSAAGVRERKKKVKECGTRIAEREMVIKNSRSQLEGEQRELTSLTIRLTECESEIEEHELKIELLNKQLKIARENQDKAEKKRSKLQDKVRSTKEKISRYNCSIQEAERSLSREKKVLQRLQSGTSATLAPSASSGEEQSMSRTPGESDIPLSQSRVVLPVFANSEKLVTVERGKEESWSRVKMVSSGEGSVLIHVTDTATEPKDGSNVEAMVTEPGVQGSSSQLSGDGSISKAVVTEPGVQGSSYLTDGEGGHSPFLLDVTLKYEVISDSESGDTTLSSTITGATADRRSESEANQDEMVLLAQGQRLVEATYTFPQSPATEIKLQAEPEVDGEQRAPSCSTPDQTDSLVVPVMSLEPVSDVEEDAGTILSSFQTETVSDPENLELEFETAPPTVLQKVPLQVPGGAAIENISDAEDTTDTAASKSPQQKEDRLIENVSEDEGDLQGAVQSGPLVTGLQIQTSSCSAFRKVSELQGSGLVQHEMIQSHHSPVEVEAISDDEPEQVDTSSSRSSQVSCEHLPFAGAPSSVQVSDELVAQAAASTESSLGDSNDQSWPSFLASDPTLGLQISKVESLSTSESAWFATSPSPVAEMILEEQPHLPGSGVHFQVVEDDVGQKEVTGGVGKTPTFTSPQLSIVQREHSYCYQPELLEFLAEPPKEYTKESKDKSSKEYTKEVEGKDLKEYTKESEDKGSKQYTKESEDKGSKDYTKENEGKDLNSPAKYSSAESTSTSTTPSDTTPSSSSPVRPTRLTSILEILVGRERKENLLSPKLEDPSCKKVGSKNRKRKRKSSSPKRLKLQTPKSSVPSRANLKVASTLNKALHSALSPPLMTLISPDHLPRIMNLIHEMPSPLQTQPSSTPLQRSSLPFERVMLERLTESVTDRLGSIPSATTSQQSHPSSTSPMQISPNVSNLVSQTVHSLSVGDFLAMSALKSSLHSAQLAARKSSCDSAQAQQQPSLVIATPASPASQPSLTPVGLQPSLVTATPALVGLQPSLSPASVGLQPQTQQVSSTPHLVTESSVSASCSDLQMSIAAPVIPSSSVIPNQSTAIYSIPTQSSATHSIDTSTHSVDIATPPVDIATHSVDITTPSVDIATPSVDIADHSLGAATRSVGSSTHSVDITDHSATQSVASSPGVSGMPASIAQVTQHGAATPASNPPTPETPQQSVSKSGSDISCEPSHSSSTSLSSSTFATPQYSVSLPVTLSTSFTAPSNSTPVFAIPRIVSEFPLEISPQAIDLSALKFLIEARRTKPHSVSAPTSASSGSTFSSRAKVSSSQDTKGSTHTVPVSSTPGPIESAALAANPESSNHQPPFIPAVVPPLTTMAVILPKPVKPVSSLSGFYQSVLSVVSNFKSTVSNLQTSPLVQPTVQTPPILPKLSPAVQAILSARMAQSNPPPNQPPPNQPPNQLPPAAQQASSKSSSASNAGRTQAQGASSASSTGIRTQSQRALSASGTGINNQNQAQMKPTPDPPSLRTLALASAVVKALSVVSSSTSVVTTSPSLVSGASASIVRLPGGSGGQSPRLQVPPNSKLKGQILSLQKDLAQLKGQLAAKTALTAVSMATTGVQSQAVSQQATQTATARATCTSSTFLKRPIPSSSASEPPLVSGGSKSVVVSGAPSKSDPLPSSSSKPATLESVESIQESNLRAALRVFGIEKSGEQLQQLRSSICTPNPLNVHELLEKALPLSSLSPSPSTCRMLNAPLPTLTIPESVVSAVENQERQRGGTSNSKGAESPSKESYKPYSSPLLMLQSYRLSPLYRTQAKLPLSSLTYSNKINPHKIMCKFELLGVCNDPNCVYQHIRDVRLSREELVQDLISYQPTLAGCTVTDLSVVDETQPELQENISGKVSEYTRNLMQTYSGKIRDEELYALTTHKVNQERERLNSKNTRKSFVSVEERYWIQEHGGTSKSVQQRRTGEGLSLVGAGKEGEGDDVVPLGGHHPPNMSSHVKRYFATGESESAEERVQIDPGDTTAWVELAQKAVGRRKALTYLERGLEANRTSEKLWVEFLLAKSHDLSTRDPPTTGVSEGHTSATNSGEEWDQLCARAMGSQPSYAVAFECVRLAQTYDAKRKWIQEGLKCCGSWSNPPTSTSSHQCLELLLNSVLLDLLSGRGDVAMTTMNSALFSREQPSPFSGLSSQLTQEDKVIACLSHICLLLSNTLPCTLFESPDCTPPTRVIRKESVAIPWSKATSLSQQQREKIRELFDFVSLPPASIELCSNYESSTPTPHALLRLHGNFILFEFTQNQEKAITMLEKLLTVTPTAAKLWLLHIRLDERRGSSGLGVVARALETCPRTAELYHLAARAELSQASVDAPERLAKAIRWLEQCVRQFYQIPPHAELDHSETLLLYRKLLGQLVPYTYQPPVFAEGVKPKQLGSRNLVHLWMCYCLLVELTLPSVHGGFHPTSVSDAFESALLSVREKEGVRVLWREYLTYLRSQAVDEGVHSFKAFSDCVHRCLVAVDSSYPFPHPLYGQPSHYKDYSFHNEVVDMMLSCLPHVSSYALAVMQKFTQILPGNSVLVARLVKCALDQIPKQVELAQSSMASFLADDPRCLLLWRMAIAVELRLNHMREARWMYRQAVKALPFHILLWKEFLLFEMRELATSHVRHSTAPLLELATMTQHIGIDLRSLLNS